MRHGPQRPGRRCLVALTTLALMATGAAACTSDDAQPRAKPKRQTPTTAAPVPDPGPRDTVLPASAVAPRPLSRGAGRPNILLITADDAAIGDLDHMPKLQQYVADEGVTVENGLAPTPICVPARASLITGQYAHNHGAVTIEGEGGGFDAFADQDTLPVWLQAAGYDTMFVGKYLNGYGEDDATYVPPGWTDWQATVDPTTYDFEKPTINHNGELSEHEEYSTDLLRDLAVEQISEPARQDKPWYMWVNYVAPHTGQPAQDDDPAETDPDNEKHLKTTVPAREYEDTFEDQDLPDTPDMFEAETSDKTVAKLTWDRWNDRDRELLRESYQQRLEALQSVDDAVADTIEALRDTGQLDNTWVVFTGDNGYSQGEHNIAGKLWYFSDILGIPMVMRGPGLPHGKVVSTPVTNPDLATTFAALAGATPTRPQDGVDVTPYLTTDADTRVVPIEGYRVKGGLTPLYYGVWAGPWTYVRTPARREELYNRDLDPWQLSSVAADPRFATQLRELRRLAKEQHTCAGETCAKEFYSSAQR
ncbi:sulfatase family protein [Nocardioides sp. LHG3406-4]|uniref:sulfatase family protein n=1 Tax=Nocardioides sp. LHG3406-4 TaxID=2804575 RepID=UPI003CFAB1CB